MFSPDGIELVEVNDVQFFLPIAVGSLEAVYPPDVAGAPQYSGTSHTDEGLSETKYVTVREWRDFGNAANMLRWAAEIHGAICDTVIEGDVEYLGLLTDVLVPGHAVNLPGNGYTTGWEAIDLPVARCSLEYHSERSATSYSMNIHLSNRRSPYSGEAFLRPAQTGLSVSGPAGFVGGFDGSANAEAYQNAAAAHQNGSFGGLGTGNATSMPGSGISFQDQMAGALRPGSGIRDQATNPNRDRSAPSGPLPNTKIRMPKSPEEQARIANLGNHVTDVSAYSDLGKQAPDISAYANLGKRKAPEDLTPYKNLGRKKPEVLSDRIKNLGRHPEDVSAYRNLGVPKADDDPEEVERIRRLGQRKDD